MMSGKEYPYGLPCRLKKECIKNTKLVIDRHEQLHLLPKNGVVAEIGCFEGKYSQEIINIITPKKLYLIEICEKYRTHLRKKFKKYIAEGTVEIINENSNIAFKRFKDGEFDFIYIDGDHTYEAVQSDILNFYKKIKDDGYMVLNDYIYYSWNQKEYYGIMQAVNSFCNKFSWEIVYYTLSTSDYKDVILKRIQGNP